MFETDDTNTAPLTSYTLSVVTPYLACLPAWGWPPTSKINMKLILLIVEYT
jgi:hypothetical protein